jgi:hypothetical protein
MDGTESDSDEEEADRLYGKDVGRPRKVFVSKIQDIYAAALTSLGDDALRESYVAESYVRRESDPGNADFKRTLKRYVPTQVLRSGPYYALDSGTIVTKGGRQALALGNFVMMGVKRGARWRFGGNKDVQGMGKVR